VIYYPGFDYISQLPDAADGTPGHLMIGGGFLRSKEQGLDQVGIWDDSRMDALPAMHLHGTMPAVFRPNWGSGAAVDMAWTGILDFTGDSLPLVGRLPSSTAAKEIPGLHGSGEWISAGFNGEGMVWAWLCSTAAAVMILGLEEEDLKPGVGRPGGRLRDWFVKDVLAVNEKRLRRANLKNMADAV
jgi:glycine/D-amino acid oxidase-like deaminating enzyme